MSLRPGLLTGRRVGLVGAGIGAGSELLAERLRALGAELMVMPEPASADEGAAAAWVAGCRPLEALVCDARAYFGTGGSERLRAALDRSWICAHAVATGALIPAPNGGRLLFITPAADAGPLAGAARAGLESLARTLSVEWARHTLTAVAVCPGAGSTEDEVAELLGFLLSAAGGYFSGCRLDLGLTGAPAGS
ncbi:MAG TPA: hypothetical protein VF781_14285 [Solirubrobacteraceae bacterium]